MPSTRSRLVVALLVAILAACAGCSASTPSGAWVITPGTLRSPSASPAPGAGADPSAIGTSPQTATAPVIVTIGDSIMAGFGLNAGEDWPTLLAHSTGLSVTNLACSGAGFIADGDCGSHFAGLIDAAVAASPTMVIVQSSDNDDGESDTALNDAAMSTMVALRNALPDATIIGLSTLWNQPSDPPAEIAASTQALHTAIDAVGGTFIDIGQPLQNQTDLMQFDDEHPTAAGQQVLLDTITSAFADAGVGL